MKQKVPLSKMNMTKTLLSVMLCCCCSIMAFGQNMTQEIEKIIKGKQASVGVAIIHNDDIIAIANEDKYPTMSVFKFHIAVTALKKNGSREYSAGQNGVYQTERNAEKHV
ncbi:hypothetical protein NXX35_06470 [Bacteroides xylanisolvens]|nr:hypothetical protein NXX35_06470 [Bacteroides xylanisolvens]